MESEKETVPIQWWRQRIQQENRGWTLIDMNEEYDDSFMTPWSLVHFLSGAAMKGMGWGWWPTFALHAAYEYKDYLAHPDIYNSPLNSAGDQTMAMAGWLAAKKGDKRMFWFWLLSFGAAVFTKEELGVDIG